MERPKIKLGEGAQLPERKSADAVAYDLKTPMDVTIHKGRQVIPLNFCIAVPKGYEAKIEPRSGFASRGIQDNCGVSMDADVLIGKIDPDYRGTVGVIVKSSEDFSFVVAKGTRIAQMTFYKVESEDWDVVEELDKTERGAGGFGSTGAK